MENSEEHMSENSKKKSLKKNYIYNVIYQIFILIVPLVTAPYISRVLLPEGVGQYSFTFSLQSYFILIAALGFGYYAQREVANHQNDTHTQSKIFWEINIVRLFSVVLAVGINMSLCFIGVYQSYQQLMLWWTLNIVAVAFDITFLLQGNEDFGRIVGRNVLVKVISVFLIFVLVKKSSDVWLYVVLTSSATLLGNLTLWVYLPRYLCKVKFSELEPWRHVWPTIRLFIPTIATSIYTVLDKTLIGVLIPGTYIVQESQIINGVETVVDVVKKYSDLENGYYEQSEKIVKMCLAVIGALGTIMIPRNSKLYAEGNQEGLKKNIYFATKYVWFLGVPMMFGLAAVAPNLIPWFLGEGYEKCILLMQLFTPLIILIGFSNVFGLQFLVPTKRDKKFTIGIFAGTISNLALNCVFIPILWANGAVIASVFAELLVTITMFMLIRKEISLKVIMKQSIKPLIAGVIMFFVVFLTQSFLKPKWYFTLVLILLGIVVYLLIMLILRDDSVNNMVCKIKQFFLKIDNNKTKNSNVLGNKFLNGDDKRKERDYNLDLIKLISCIAVVVTHAIRSTNDFVLNDLIYYSCSFAVPFFFVVDGYLLLNKNKITIQYCAKKFISMLVLIYVWVIPYTIYSCIKNGFTWENLANLYQWLTMDNRMGHFWFLGSMLIIYLVLPLLFKLIHHNPLLLIVFEILFFVTGSTLLILSFCYRFAIESIVYQVFRVWIHWFYFIIGGFIGKHREMLPKVRKCLFPFILLTIISFAINVIFDMCIANNILHDYRYEFFYFALPNLAFYSFFFLLLLEIPLSQCVKNTLNVLSPCTLGTYLAHVFVITVFLFLLKLFNINDDWYQRLWITPIVTISTFAIVFVVKRIPLLKYTVEEIYLKKE